MKSIMKTMVSGLVVCCVLGTAALAQESERIVSVSGDGSGTYEGIQEAIDAIASGEECSRWTIEVSAGEYEPFSVPAELDGLTVCAAGQSAPVILSGEAEGIQIGAERVTLSGLRIQSPGNHTAAVSAEETASNLAVQSCVFQGDDAGDGLFCANADGLTVENCSFDGFAAAISLEGNDVREEILLRGNSIANCDRALCGSFFGKTGSVLVFSGNTVNGTADRRCGIQISDCDDSGAVLANLRDNTLFYVYATLENMDEPGEVISAFSEKNVLTASALYDGTAAAATAVPKTGDRSLVILWAVCVAAFGAGVVLMLRRIGKKQ